MPNLTWPPALGPVICVVGARPNFMKMAPILRAFSENVPAIPTLLVHTGQHYDKDMNDRLFVDLRLPHPDINLEVGSGTHAVQTVLAARLHRNNHFGGRSQRIARQQLEAGRAIDQDDFKKTVKQLQLAL